MQTQQAIQAQAQVVRITQVSAGDVYKRFDTSYDDRVYYGVVNAVHNDGENAIIEATEYCRKYSELEVSMKVLKGSSDYVLFPATPEELSFEFEKSESDKKRSIEAKKKEIAKLEQELEHIRGLMTGKTQKKLKAMSYKEMTQSKFEELKQLI